MCRNVRIQKPGLLDHLIGAQGWWNSEAERLRGPDVDVHIVSARLLNRELGRLFSTQDLINVRSRLLSYSNKIGSKAYQTTGNFHRGCRRSCSREITCRPQSTGAESYAE
jgi:hypothetical protein